MAMSKKRRIFYSLITLIAIVLCAFSFSVKVHGAPGDETGEGDKQELIDEFETNVSALFGYSEEFDQTINSIFDYLATFIDSESDYGALVDTISNLKHEVKEDFLSIIESDADLLKDDLGDLYQSLYDKYIENMTELNNSNYVYDFSMIRNITDSFIDEAASTAIVNKYEVLSKGFEQIELSDLDNLITVYSDYNDFIRPYIRYIALRSEAEGYLDRGLIEDYLNKAKYLGERSNVISRIFALINVHDDEVVSEKLETYLSSIESYNYERCLSSRDTYYSDMVNNLSYLYNEGKEYVYFLQAKERFTYYFEWFYQDTVEKEIYSSENLEKISELISLYNSKLDELNEKYEVEYLKEELISKINEIEKLVIEVAVDEVNSTSFMATAKNINEANGNYTLRVYLVPSEYSWATKAYSINIYNELGEKIDHFDDKVEITILDDLSMYNSFSLYTLKNGERYLIPYDYDDGKLVVRMNDIEDIYLVNHIKAPYIAMGITFGALIGGSILLVSILKRKKLL